MAGRAIIKRMRGRFVRPAIVLFGCGIVDDILNLFGEASSLISGVIIFIKSKLAVVKRWTVWLECVIAGMLICFNWLKYFKYGFDYADLI